ncbi:PPOX class F420-dependent oxidoreductase [Spongiibacter sp. KMU-158]|uniref:PPOX class F420-dependent oxidoreductase n=1 Tax=Spongiibacter pelagi TaxID=2760804 RepID=A0A927BXT0_9GAMM|nr:PPOX class F420-dependent oxidoreductase [Spongiibacter pelagi]MBD2857519.1 PPOX class F420-dependent oxidoreductase [Spongiibacter pelagi]
MSDLILAPYVLFSTRKRDGSFVPTPVWAAGNVNTLYVFSAGNAGKVKRLRNFSDCKLARCTVNGKRLGEDVDANAYLIDGKEAEQAHRALVSKYGWQMRLLDIGSRLGGRMKTRQYIRVDLKTD